MHRDRVIGGGQLFCLLWLARLFTTLTFHAGAGTAGGVHTLLAMPLAALLGLAALGPWLWLLSRSPGGSVLDGACICSPLGSRALAALLWVALGVLAALTAADFVLFLSATAYSRAPVGWGMLLLFLAVAVYGAFLGAQALGRLAVYLAAAFCVGIGLMAAALWSQVEWRNLYLPSLQEAGQVLQAAARLALGNTELLLWGVLAGQANRGPGRVARWQVLASSGGLAVLAFFTVTVLGGYAAARAYPVYTLMSYGQLSFLRRMDLVHIALWSLVALLRSGAYLFGAGVCVRMLFPARWEKAALAGTVAWVCAAAWLLWYFPAARQAAKGVLAGGWAGGALLVLLPAFFWLVGAARRGKDGKKA